MARLRRQDGARVSLQLAPKPGAGEQQQAKRLFDNACKLVQAEWKKRSPPITKGPVPSKKRRQPSRSHLPWLMVTAYEIIGEMLQLEHDDVFAIRIAEHGRGRRGRIGDPNRFQVGLMAMFADDQKALNARDRDRIGKKLWRAYRHYVPSEFLIGFAKQPKGELFPGYDLSREFRDWIIDRRAEESAAENESRGEYPSEIEDAVELKQSLRRSSENDDWDGA